jgi:hypothetical protein
VTLPAATVALDDQLLAVLRDSEGFPLATEEVCELVGAVGPGEVARVLRRLNRFKVAGRVERVTVEGWRSVYWRGV